MESGMEIKEFGENGAGYRLRKFIVRFDGTDAVVKTPKYICIRIQTEWDCRAGFAVD